MKKIVKHELWELETQLGKSLNVNYGPDINIGENDERSLFYVKKENYDLNDIEKELEVYESSFKKIENLDFLNIIDRSFYYLEVLTNTLTEDQAEKNIKGIYNNLEQYKLLLLREKRKQSCKKDKEDIDFKIDRINKFLFMKRLEIKYVEKNNKEKRGKI